MPAIYTCAKCGWTGDNPFSWGIEPAGERYCARCLGTVSPVTPPSDGTRGRWVKLRIVEQLGEGDTYCRAIWPDGTPCTYRAIPESRVEFRDGCFVEIRIPSEETNGLCGLHDSKTRGRDPGPPWRYPRDIL